MPITIAIVTSITALTYNRHGPHYRLGYQYGLMTFVTRPY